MSAPAVGVITVQTDGESSKKAESLLHFRLQPMGLEKGRVQPPLSETSLSGHLMQAWGMSFSQEESVVCFYFLLLRPSSTQFEVAL